MSRATLKTSMRRGLAARIALLAILCVSFAAWGGRSAGQGNAAAGKKATSQPKSVAASATHEDELIEGEKRFHNNCGRCHMAPQKFPPRVMAMVIRHMRVRATITDEDMRLILKYMTQ